MARPRKADRAPYDVDSLTDVALEVFRQRGFEATSVVHIAQAAGLTKSSLYHHVNGKEELLTRGLGRALDALFASLDEEPARAGRAIDRLAHVIRRGVELEFDLLPEVTVLLRARGNTEAERRALERRRQYDKQVAEIVAEAQLAGDARSDIHPVLVTRLVFGMINSLTEWYRPTGSVSRDEVVRAILSTVFDGILTGSAARPDRAPLGRPTAGDRRATRR